MVKFLSVIAEILLMLFSAFFLLLLLMMMMLLLLLLLVQKPSFHFLVKIRSFIDEILLFLLLLLLLLLWLLLIPETNLWFCVGGGVQSHFHFYLTFVMLGLVEVDLGLWQFHGTLVGNVYPNMLNIFKITFQYLDFWLMKNIL